MDSGQDNEFEFFQYFNFDEVEELYKVFPFYESYGKEDNNYDNDVLFPNSDFYNTFDNHKNIMDGDQLLEKINKFEKSYNNLIHSDIISSPAMSMIFKFINLF
jgi:hypothetical protein